MLWAFIIKPLLCDCLNLEAISNKQDENYYDFSVQMKDVLNKINLLFLARFARLTK